MEKAGKQAAKRAYRERKLNAGVFAIHCMVENRRWIAAAPDIPAAQNRFLFRIRNSEAPNATIAAALKAHGEAAFSFETLELVDPEKPPLYLSDHLAERAAFWREKLQACPL